MNHTLSLNNPSSHRNERTLLKLTFKVLHFKLSLAYRKVAKFIHHGSKPDEVSMNFPRSVKRVKLNLTRYEL